MSVSPQGSHGFFPSPQAHGALDAIITQLLRTQSENAKWLASQISAFKNKPGTMSPAPAITAEVR